MLGNLQYQIVPPTETLVYVSGLKPSRIGKLREHFPHCRFSRQPDLQDWGHDKRRQGVQDAAGDYLGFFNDDDSYDNAYLHTMLHAVADGADAAYCAWNEQPNCSFGLGSSTAGNFIVRTSLARSIGYPVDHGYECDGHFINAVEAFANQVVRVDEILYWHNTHACA